MSVSEAAVASPVRRDKGMSEIAGRHAAIAELLPADRSIAYLDYALTTNVGDQLIVLGTLEFFKRYGIKRRFSRNVRNSERIGELPIRPDDIIVLHGGGNFGDIYPHFQKYREDIIDHYKDNKIIMMPQTVHFNAPDALARSAERMNRHRDLTLFVRDTISFDLVRPYFGERAILMPDMAHQLWPMLSRRCTGEPPEAAEPLMLIRTDVERAGTPAPIAERSQMFQDWDDLLSRSFRITKRVVASLSQTSMLRRAPVDWDELYFRAMESEIIAIAQLLSKRSPWISSRLHGIILGLLLDKPVFAIDNSYGKLSSYLNTWHDYLKPVVMTRSDADGAQAVAFAESSRRNSRGDVWHMYERIARGEPWNR